MDIDNGFQQSLKEFEKYSGYKVTDPELIEVMRIAYNIFNTQKSNK